MLSLLYDSTLTSIHDYWKKDSFDDMDLCRESDVSALNLFSKFVIVFLPRSQCLLILWLQSPSIVILEPKKIKSVRYYFTIKIVELYPVAYLSYMLKLSKTFK